MPTTISHYRLDEEIGRGGMGVVYRAVDTRLGRPVAIKMLPAGATADPDRNRRFVQEARSASALNHPGIVTIHDIDEEDGATFIAMELVEGTTLDRILARGTVSVPMALDYAAQIAAALGAAHASGIIHRDVKPANIMVTPDGRVKILDFGLAKLVERAPAEPTLTALTRPGLVMGTAAYMSPEQAEGRPVDARSDVFSFGAVFYEMLAGRRPFGGNSDVAVITAILRDAPPPLRTVRAEVPAGVGTIVERALAKDPAARYGNGVELKRALDAARVALARPTGSVWWRPAVALPMVAAMMALAGFGAWQTVKARRARTARLEGIPRIEQLIATPRVIEAMRLARQLENDAPEDVARLRRGWLPFVFATEPAGAAVEIKDYSDLDGRWEPLGQTPVTNVMLPFGFFRMRIAKAGYVPLEIARDPATRHVKLADEQTSPAGMVRVDGGPYSYGVSASVVLPDYWIDRYEVTNRQFKQFVDAGGYRDAKYWTEPMTDAGRTLPFAEAMARFRDATDRPGPALWELGSYPEGQADFPVGGISWFEASAYAAFAGKSLPSVYHWYRASGVDQIYSDILTFSNFDGKGAARVGERQGIGPWGTSDMAGNVKEWCRNLAQGTPRRYILGGGWNEPNYRFIEADARDPWDRSVTFGVRLVKDLGAAVGAGAPLGTVNPDPMSVVPLSDAEFEPYRRFYAYDRTPLDARLDATDDRNPEYRKEKVSFTAAYGHERIPAYVFLPKHAIAPYQTVVFFPSAYSRNAPSSDQLDLATFDFIVKSGRALIYPIYQGTFERHNRGLEGPSSVRDMQVQWAKDFFRAVDYLETRRDVDSSKLGYYSLSMGAYFAPIPLALEPRIKVAAAVAGGMRYNLPPEIQTANFMPRVRIPMLLINGKDDFSASPASQERYLQLLGTAPADKKHVALPGGHVPNDMHAQVREVLNWYDKYLGVVR